jgi:osmotically-inducible protein OsmY
VKRLHIVGMSAIAAAVAAFFFHPRKGAGRRQAVRRGGEKLARHGASATSLVGTRRRHAGRQMTDVGERIQDALLEELGADGFSLRVTAGDDETLTVRGEVGSLELIRRASEVIERARGSADVVNLIRLQAKSAGGAVTA